MMGTEIKCTVDYFPLTVNYKNEAVRIAATKSLAATNPLSPGIPGKSYNNELLMLPSTRIANRIDDVSFLTSSAPLSLDPLSLATSLTGSVGDIAKKTRHNSQSMLRDVPEKAAMRTPWQLKKDQILAQVSMQINIAENGCGSRDMDVKSLSFSMPDMRDDKYSQRLASLGKKNSLSSKNLNTAFGDTSSMKFETQVQKISADLFSAWSKDERVKSLNIASQLASLLNDTSNTAHYPAMFVMVTDELEKYGSLLVSRIQKRIEEISVAAGASPARRGSGMDLSSWDVPAVVVDMCRSWIVKIDAISNHLARFYLQIALLRVHRFLPNTDFSRILDQLAESLKEIKDPLLAVFVRVFLVTHGQSVAPPSHYLVDMAECSLKEFTAQKIGTEGSLRALLAALEWILRHVSAYCLTLDAQPDTTWKHTAHTDLEDLEQEVQGPVKCPVPSGAAMFKSLVRIYIESCNDVHVLALIISSFSGSYFAVSAPELVTLTATSSSSCSSSGNNNGNNSGSGSGRSSNDEFDEGSSQRPHPRNDSPHDYGNVHNGRTDALTALGRQLTRHPPSERHKRAILREVWKIVGRTNSLEAYVQCACAWLLFSKVHCSAKEVLILLSDLGNILSTYISTGYLYSTDIPSERTQALTPGPHEVAERTQRHIVWALEGLLAVDSSREGAEEAFRAFHSTGTLGSGGSAGTGTGVGDEVDRMGLWTAVVTSECFMGILDTVKGPKKVVLCQEILDGFRFHPPTDDAVLLNALFDIARLVHDGVDSLSPEGDRKHSSGLLCAFVSRIDCGRDLEKQLDLYCECRSRFRNLDAVKEQLIYCVTALASKALQLMKGKHSKKTSNFVKAALAYCHITVPSVSDLLHRLRLLLHCAEAALLNCCLPQTDTFLKAAISLLPDMPECEEGAGDQGGKWVPIEERLSDCVRGLLSLLVVAPGHPNLGPFFLLKGLMTALTKISWQPHSGVKTRLYIDVFVLLCVLHQRVLPYRVAGVDSNDLLFGGSAPYLTELHQLLEVCVGELEAQLEGLEGRPPQSRCALILLAQVVGRLHLTDQVCKLLLSLLRYIQAGKAALRGVYRLHWDTLSRAHTAAAACIDDVGIAIGGTSTSTSRPALQLLLDATAVHLKEIDKRENHH